MMHAYVIPANLITPLIPVHRPRCIAKDHSEADAPCDVGLCTMRSRVDRTASKYTDGLLPIFSVGGSDYISLVALA